MKTTDIAVIVHGGAGTLPLDRATKKIPALTGARDAAWKVLEAGGRGLAAVEAALRVMEESQYFNAGFGSYPDDQGRILMDVGLMTGDRKFASYMNMERVTYPSSVAARRLRELDRSLMTVWTETMMAEFDAMGAEERERYGVKDSHDELFAPFVKELLEAKLSEVSMKSGTIGCVVRDAHGELCAGTSTGGLTGKPDGRIGDSPIIGSGVYADSHIGALSTTGTGETFLGSLFSGFLMASLRQELAAREDCFFDNPALLADTISREFEVLTQGYGVENGGAVIVVPPKGAPAFGFNSQMVSLGYRFRDADGELKEEACIALQDGSRVREGRCS